MLVCVRNGNKIGLRRQGTCPILALRAPTSLVEPATMDQSSSISASNAVRFPTRDVRGAAFVSDFLVMLVARALLDASGAERAAQAQRQSGQRIDTVLTELGLVSESQLLKAISDIFGIPLATSADFPLEPVLLPGLAPDYFVRHRLVPLSADNTQLLIATSDAFADDTLQALGYFVDLNVVPRLAAVNDIDQAIKRLYTFDESGGMPSADAAERLFVNEDDLQRLKDIASEAPIVRFVNRIIAAAVAVLASDIHIEPMTDALRVRFRIDGIVTEMERLPPDMQAGVASRIKILSKLNIAERRLPQDGRFKFVVAGREMDLRVSVTPVLHGESIVIRILDQQELEFTFSALGFSTQQSITFERLLRKPNGIVLVTGPTGSGKTTTLYAALKILNTVDRTIFSVEDPVEYQMPGVNQMQIKPNIGLDFANCLRSILRQDPDVVMVGEMRDTETVRVGIQASLTGHLVLSTLHTNSAAASITRLLDMGAQDYLLGSTLNAVIAQRLVRRLCSCARPVNDVNLLQRLLGELAVDPPTNSTIKSAVGCNACNHSGFKGRTTIVEMLVVDEHVRRLIRTGIQDGEIEAAGRQAGMETLYESGVRKVLNGQTSLDEVLRVAGA